MYYLLTGYSRKSFGNKFFMCLEYKGFFALLKSSDLLYERKAVVNYWRYNFTLTVYDS